MADTFSQSLKLKSQIADFKRFSSEIEPKIKAGSSPKKAFVNSAQSFASVESPCKSPKETKVIFLELANKRTFEIEYKVKYEKELTVGWLLSEAIRRIKAYHETIKVNVTNEANILFLTSLNKNLNLDHWLTFLDRNLSVLKDGQKLTVFFGDPKYEITENTGKIDLKYFQFQKNIGLGGFSQVILG